MHDGSYYEEEMYREETPIESSAKSPMVMDSLYSIAYSSMDQDRYLTAVGYWKRIEHKLENVSSNGVHPDPLDILVTLHNLACCYQK